MDKFGTVYLNNRQLGPNWEHTIAQAIRAATRELCLPAIRDREIVLSTQSFVPMVRLKFDRRLTFEQIDRIFTLCSHTQVHMLGLITDQQEQINESKNTPCPVECSGLAVRLFSYNEVLGPNAPTDKFTPVCLLIESEDTVKINWIRHPASEITTWFKKVWRERRDRRLYILTNSQIHYDTFTKMLSRVLAVKNMDVRIVCSEDSHYLDFLVGAPPPPREYENKAK